MSKKIGCPAGTRKWHNLCIPDDKHAEADLTLRLVLMKPGLYAKGQTQEGVENIAVKHVMEILNNRGPMGVIYINGCNVTDRRIH